MQDNLKKIKVLVVRHKDGSTTKTKSDTFHKISAKVANKMGAPSTFFLACLTIVVWGITGPIFDYSDTWQLIINTGTTIVTFLMVFVIQNTQNRDGKAMQLKLDELINSTKSARTEFVDIEALTDAELDQLQEEFKAVQQKIQDKKQKTVN
jgi:low affinity Fe/Cu permease